MRRHHRSRLATISVAAASFLFALSLAACGGGGGGSPAINPVPESSSPAGNTAKSIAFASAGTAQALPEVGGITSNIVLPSNNAPSGAQLNVAVSTTAPQALPQIPAGNPLAVAYFTMTPSTDVTMNGSPKVSMTLSAAPKNQGQFYAWLYDTSAKTWLDLASITVQGTQVVFGGTNTTLKFKRGVQYLAIPFSAVPNASCPTPSPVPTATPIPFTGEFFLGGTFIASNNALVNGSVLVYDESTGQQTATVNLGYATGTMVFSTTLSSNGNLLYVTAGTANNSGGNANASGTPIPALTIIDTATNSILHQTTIPASIFGGTLSADQTRFYGAGYDGSKSSFAVLVFDAATGAELTSIPLPAGAQDAAQIVIDNGTNTAYVLGDNLYKVDLTSGTASVFYHESNAALPLENIALDSTESKLYLAEGTRVLIFDPANGSPDGTITTPPGVEGFESMSQSADRKTLLLTEVLNQSPGYGASVVSAATGAIVNSFTFAQAWGQSSLNANGTYALLWEGGSQQAFKPAAYGIPSGTQFYTSSEPANFFPQASAAQ
jgi:hypothetical protein